MAQNIVQQQQRRPARPPKLRLASLFTDAPVRVEPEEPKKVVVAGLVEANPEKDYPVEYFKRAWAVFRGEFATLFKACLYFVIFTLPFVVIVAWFAKYFENLVLGGTYNFMGDIGVGFPGGGDSIAQSVARLYWDVKAPVYCMIAGTIILGSLGLGGLFYCVKRSYFQDHYKRITRTYWMGFAKYWWKYLVTMTFAVLVGLAMAVSILYLLKEQTLGTAGAGAYCAVVFTWVFGAPLLTIPVVMCGLFASHELTFFQAFKNALVIIANCPVMVAIVCILSAAPLLLCLAGTIFSIIVYAVMALIGTFFLALFWTAMSSRGMKKCSLKLGDMRKAELQNAKRAAKQNPYANAKNNAAKDSANEQSDYVVKPQNQQKKKPQQNHYQNPKKKKKK
ncbi:MAG: hypothetical protein IJ226_01720 [Clostridia bacterium]|nr:hypothetical protein [Clostridia bacterium]